MQPVLDVATDIIFALADMVDGACDYKHHKDDWDRTWSPVSLWLALIAAITIIVPLVVFGALAWGTLKTMLP